MDTKPWASYTESDYTLEQWHRACLIHKHDGPPTSKSQCKLPIRSPSGTVNKNGVFAAAAALAGARTPIKASSEQKAKAARALVRLYSEMDKQPPASLTKFAHFDEMEELFHYGVKGMKWGVRRTDAQLAAARKSRGAGKGTVGMTDEEAMNATLIGVGAAFVALQGVRNTFESGNVRVLKEKGKRFVQGKRGGVQYKKKPELAKKNMSENEIMDSVVKDINPEFGKFGTKMNCRRCTMAYEMRRRGNDVKATKTTNARGQHGKGLKKAANASTGLRDGGENKVYDAAFKTAPKDAAAKATFSMLAKEPNGSRGEVGMFFQLGGGHSVAYEIVRGKPVIFDTQSGIKVTNPKEWHDAFGKAWAVNTVHTTRLDNKTLNEGWLERWVKNND